MKEIGGPIPQLRSEAWLEAPLHLLPLPPPPSLCTNNSGSLRLCRDSPLWATAVHRFHLTTPAVTHPPFRPSSLRGSGRKQSGRRRDEPLGHRSRHA